MMPCSEIHSRPETLERILKALICLAKALRAAQRTTSGQPGLIDWKKETRSMRNKDDFAQQAVFGLLGSGLEVSYVYSREEADLVVRMGKQRAPFCFAHDKRLPQRFGTLLTAMYQYSSTKGFVCRPRLTPEEKKPSLSTNTASGSLPTRDFPKSFPNSKTNKY